MCDIVVIGGGGHATTVITAIRKGDKYRIKGYLDPADRGELLGVPYLGDDSSFLALKGEEEDNRVALGLGILNVEHARVRHELMQRFRRHGWTFPAIRSPDCIVNEEVAIGPGSLLADGVIVNSRVKIGEGVIVNTGASIDHDCEVGDQVHIAPGATISGGVRIEDRVIVGAGATVIEEICVAAGTHIGAGAVVVRNIELAGLYVGNPARRIR
ncbi:acetyltransferase [Rhodothermus sp. AH-315-K08]|nr:acetyltransferase [Rhodothermus sp. AH-315-K08]